MATCLAFDSSSAADPVNERLLVLENLLELAERAQANVRASGSAIAVRQGDSLIVRTSTGAAPEVGAALRNGEGVVGKCTRQPYCGSPAPGEIDAVLAAAGVRSLVAVPIQIDGEFLGVLIVTSQVQEAFSRMHVAILVTMVGDTGRVLRRLEALTQQPVPVAAATPVRNVPESPSPAASTAPVTKPQGLVETLKELELKPAAPANTTSDRPQANRIVTSASPGEAFSAQRMVTMSAMTLESETTARKDPAPELLGLGEDPLKFGQVAKIKKETSPTTFTTGVAYRAPARRNNYASKFLSFAVVLLIAISAFQGWRYYSAAQAATTAYPHVSFAASSATPAGLTAVPVASTHKDAVAVEVAAKPSPVRAEESKPVAQEPPAEVAEAPEKVEPAEPALTIAPAAKSSKTESEVVEAPSLTSVDVTSNAGGLNLPAPKLASPELVARQSVVSPAVAIHTVAPIYPDYLRSAGFAGVVHLKLNVSSQGAVTGINAVDGPVSLRQAAIVAARQWRFRPATLNGRPVSSTVDAAVRFSN